MFVYLYQITRRYVLEACSLHITTVRTTDLIQYTGFSFVIFILTPNSTPTVSRSSFTRMIALCLKLGTEYSRLYYAHNRRKYIALKLSIFSSLLIPIVEPVSHLVFETTLSFVFHNHMRCHGVVREEASGGVAPGGRVQGAAIWAMKWIF
jgi:hypothetical protein